MKLLKIVNETLTLLIEFVYPFSLFIILIYFIIGFIIPDFRMILDAGIAALCITFIYFLWRFFVYKLIIDKKKD